MARIFEITDLQAFLDQSRSGDGEHRMHTLLQMADFLDDNQGLGRDPSAAAFGHFIRLQLAQETLPHWDWHQKDLQPLCDKLLQHYANDWFGVTPPNFASPDLGITHMTFRGGFPDTVTMSMKDFNAHGAEVFERFPTVRGLRTSFLEGLEPTNSGVAFAANPLLERLRHLHLEHCAWGDPDTGHNGLVETLTSPHLLQLESLHLNGWGLLTPGGTNRFSEALFDQPRDALRSLDFSGEPGNTVGELASQSHWILLHTTDMLRGRGRHWHLTSLNLSGMQCGSPIIEEIAAVPEIGPLESLDLSNCDMRNGNGLRAICDGAMGAHLKHLNLEGNWYLDAIADYSAATADHGLSNLGKKGVLPQLESLNLRRISISDRGMTALAGSEVLSHLKALMLGRNNMISNQWRTLFSSPQPKALELLDASNPQYTDNTEPNFDSLLANLPRLASNPAYSNLRSLSLESQHFGGDKLAILAASKTLTKLVHLNMDNAGVTDKGMAALAKSPLLEQLVSLNVFSAQMHSAGVTSLITAAGKLAAEKRAIPLQTLTILPAYNKEWNLHNRWDNALKALATGKGLQNLTQLNAELVYAPIDEHLATTTERAMRKVEDRWLKSVTGAGIPVAPPPAPPPPGAPPPVSPPTSMAPGTVTPAEPGLGLEP